MFRLNLSNDIASGMDKILKNEEFQKLHNPLIKKAEGEKDLEEHIEMEVEEGPEEEKEEINEFVDENYGEWEEEIKGKLTELIGDWEKEEHEEYAEDNSEKDSEDSADVIDVQKAIDGIFADSNFVVDEEQVKEMEMAALESVKDSHDSKDGFVEKYPLEFTEPFEEALRDEQSRSYYGRGSDESPAPEVSCRCENAGCSHGLHYCTKRPADHLLKYVGPVCEDCYNNAMEEERIPEDIFRIKEDQELISGEGGSDIKLERYEDYENYYPEWLEIEEEDTNLDEIQKELDAWKMDADDSEKPKSNGHSDEDIDEFLREMLGEEENGDSLTEEQKKEIYKNVSKSMSDLPILTEDPDFEDEDEELSKLYRELEIDSEEV